MKNEHGETNGHQDNGLGEVRQKIDALDAQIQAILSRPLAGLFEIRAAAPDVPERARIYASVVCTGCGERTMEIRVRLFQGQPYCIPCFEQRARNA